VMTLFPLVSPFFDFDSVQRPATKARKILPMDVFPFVLSYTRRTFLIGQLVCT
jgi:hypothetical protein